MQITRSSNSVRFTAVYKSVSIATKLPEVGCDIVKGRGAARRGHATPKKFVKIFR